MSEPTMTKTAAPSSAAPSSETPIEQAILGRTKPPTIQRVDIKSFSDLPEGEMDDSKATKPNAPLAEKSDDTVPEVSTQDFLDMIEGKSKIPKGPLEDKVEDDKKGEKTDKVEDPKKGLDLGLDDLDLTGEKKADPKPDDKPKGKEANLAELRRKAEETEKAAKEKDDLLAAEKKRNAELEARLEAIAFEKSPKFNERFQKPYEDAKLAATQFAKAAGLEESVVAQALSMSEVDRINFIEETFADSPLKAAKFGGLLDQLASKKGDLDSAIANHRQTHQVLQDEEVKAQRQTQELINKRFDIVRDHLASRSEYFRLTGDDKADKVVNERVAAAKALIDGTASPNDLAAAPFLAAIAKEAVQDAANARAELAKYKARFAEDTAANARVVRGQQTVDESGVGKDGKPQSATSLLHQTLHRG